jgi:hypothetical protein
MGFEKMIIKISFIYFGWLGYPLEPKYKNPRIFLACFGNSGN